MPASVTHTRGSLPYQYTNTFPAPLGQGEESQASSIDLQMQRTSDTYIYIVIYLLTVHLGPEDVMRKKAGDDVVAEGGHVGGGGLGEESGDVAEVAEEEAWGRAMDALGGKGPSDLHRREVVAGDGDPSGSCQQEKEW